MLLRNALMLGVLVWTAGCASWGDMKRGLDGLLGKPLDAAIAKLGYPTAEQTIAGRKLYRWQVSEQSTIVTPTVATTTGTVGAGLGSVPYSVRTTSAIVEPVVYHCQIVLEVDKMEIVQRYQYDGNLGGCESYITRLVH